MSTAPATLDAWREFAEEALAVEVPAVVGERAYLVPDPDIAEAGLRLVRPGLLAGRARPGRFEPAHALAMAIDPALARLNGLDAAALALFTGLGFSGEALLADHIRDRDGNLRDLMVLAHHVGETWAGMDAVGLTEALDTP